MSQAELVDYQWLVGPEGDRRLEAAKSAAVEGVTLTQLAAKLRRDLSAARTHLVLEQLELREKAKQKFARADQMYFTRLGLEQATDPWVAGYKAGRFPRGRPAADLCCGIGGDLLGLVWRGPVRAVDRNPVALALAQANVEAAGDADPVFGTGRTDPASRKHPVEFEACYVCPDVLGNAAAWHIDPDRRPAGKRTTKVELHEPGPEVLQQLLAVCPNGAIKLAPAADVDEPWLADAELEWISRGRQCRQLVAWFGELAHHPGRRRATIVRLDIPPDPSGPLEPEPAGCMSFVAMPHREPPVTPQIGRHLFEPDPAVLAAKLEGALAVETNLMAIAPGVAYFTADRPSAGPMLDCFEVLDVMPYRTKLLREWLAGRGIRRLEVKKRGVPLDPAKVRRELLSGNRREQDSPEEITLILARIGGRIMAIFAKRLLR